MARLFISHSSADNPSAKALTHWLEEHGWNDVFLDIHAERGLVAGEKWNDALKAAADRCEAVLCLVSPAWLDSKYCQAEFQLAKWLGKRIFGLIVDPVPRERIPVEMTAEWQMCELIGEDRLRQFEVEVLGEPAQVAFREAGLDLLRRGLERAGLDAKSFPWPPRDEPNRAPYRGLKALEPQDAAIFFGRDAWIVRGLDHIRGLAERGVERMLIILGASGSGKSSFMRAGLWPRLLRDDLNFLPLPIVRPQTAVLSGSTGFAAALSGAFTRLGETRSPGRVRDALADGPHALCKLLGELSGLAKRRHVALAEPSGDPVIVLPLDQAEELFLPEGGAEAGSFIDLLAGMLAPTEAESPRLLVIATMRSDRLEFLQNEPRLQSVKRELFDLPPIPPAEFKDAIEGPAHRVAEAGGRLAIDPALSERLITDAAGADALPLLGFTLERLYADYGAEGRLTVAEYERLGGVQGSIEAAVAAALVEPGRAPAIPAEPEAQFAALRTAFIPWLARIEPETGAAMRRVARRDEIPEGSRAIVDRLVAARLLVADRRDGADVVEIAHESLLRNWPALTVWLDADAADLALIEGVERAAAEWQRNGRLDAWLDHRGERLMQAYSLLAREDFRRRLGDTAAAYLAACRKTEARARNRRRRVQGLIYLLLSGIIVGLIGWINQDFIKEQANWFTVMRPYMLAKVRPYVLAGDAERALTAGSTFRECTGDCPEMIVVPAGSFTIGSPVTEPKRYQDEGPQNAVTIARPFAISKFDVTFAEWDVCAAVGGCPYVSDSGFGRGSKPVINVSWEDAQKYVAWFARMTGRAYRLLSEAEWEYAARAGTTTVYFWGNEVGVGNANCTGCGSRWDNRETSPVGSFKPNAFGLYDMAGNVWQWTQDCYHNSYEGAPKDGSAWLTGDCSRRIRRGGGWAYSPWLVRSANRGADSPVNRSAFVGFRIARTLSP